MSPVYLKIHPNAPKSVQHSNTRPPQLHEYDTHRHRTVVENKCKREQARTVSSSLLSKRHTGEEKKKKILHICIYRFIAFGETFRWTCDRPKKNVNRILCILCNCVLPRICLLIQYYQISDGLLFSIFDIFVWLGAGLSETVARLSFGLALGWSAGAISTRICRFCCLVFFFLFIITFHNPYIKTDNLFTAGIMSIIRRQIFYQFFFVFSFP